VQPTKELIDAVYRERVERARRTAPADRLRMGLQLFSLTSRLMADGIRARFPDADAQRVQLILREQLALIRQREELS
jgi:hypothetical protein